jgi:hypothetical protein
MGPSVVSSSPGQPPITGAEIAVAVLKKAQDVRKAEGHALVELVRQSLAPGVGGRINVYA